MVQNPRYPLVLVLKDHGADFNLLPYLEELEYEETGNDELSHATIKLNAHFGKFIKPVTQVGVAIPKIEFFDRIYIEFTDPNGFITKDVVEVINKEPTEMPGTGDVLELNCDHQGWHFFRMHSMKQYQRESNFEMIKDMGNVYNSPDVKGTLQPDLFFHDAVYNPLLEVGNAASQATSIDMDFSNSEFLIGEGVQAVSDRAGASVDAGGELEFFDWRTVSAYDHGLNTGLDQIRMVFKVSGDIGLRSKVTLDKNNPTEKILDTRSILDPEKSTAIHGWGDNNSGSLLPGFMIYFGEKEKFFAAPDWVDLRVYKLGMRVNFEGSFYNALQDHAAADGVNDPTTGLGVFWTGPEAFVPSTDYSQFTKDKPQYWINSGAGYIEAGTFPTAGFPRAAMHDQNLVIRDLFHRRSWVDVKVTGLSAVPNSMHIQGGSDVMYRGFRVLLDTELGVTPLIGPWNLNGGKDRNGKNFDDSIVQHNGATFTGSEEWKNWDVFLETKDDLEIIVMRDGLSYIWNPCDGLTFNNTCTGSRTNGWNLGTYKSIIQLGGGAIGEFDPGAIPDCLHPYKIIGTNNPDFGTDQGIEDGIPGQNSAVRVFYDFVGARNHGAWLNFAFPVPRDGFATAGFSATVVGEKYLNPTLDLNNKHLSSLAKRGLNQGVDSEGRGSLDYGKLNAVRLYIKMVILAGNFVQLAGGDIKIRMAFFDTSDNVVIKDMTISHKNNFSELEPTIPFEIYRGRSGVQFTPVEELEILDIFETRNVVRISIATLASYDDEGRYNTFNLAALFNSMEMQVDGFHFVKPLSATTQTETIQGNKPGRNLERTPIDSPQISNFKQLESHILSMLEIEQFKRVEFETTRPLRCNIKFGDEYVFKHPLLVDDPDIGPNDEVDLVCRRNIFNYKKGKGGGGFTTKTVGVKRFRT